MSEAKGRVDTATRRIDALSPDLYGAFVDPAALIEWLPPQGMTGQIVACGQIIDRVAARLTSVTSSWRGAFRCADDASEDYRSALSDYYLGTERRSIQHLS
jgi:hypothetical protein